MTITLDAIPLDDNLHWSNEYGWTPIDQEREKSTEGTLIINEGTLQAGRPITLSGNKDEVWITKANLDILYAYLNTVADMTLTLHDARAFTVRWDNESGEPIVIGGTVISGLADPISTTYYNIKELKFIEV